MREFLEGVGFLGASTMKHTREYFYLNYIFKRMKTVLERFLQPCIPNAPVSTLLPVHPSLG